MDIAFVDRFAREKTGVKHLIVRQDLFDRRLDSRGRRQKIVKSL